MGSRHKAQVAYLSVMISQRKTQPKLEHLFYLQKQLTDKLYLHVGISQEVFLKIWNQWDSYLKENSGKS